MLRFQSPSLFWHLSWNLTVGLYFSVIAAANVVEAWELLENPNHRFDLVLLDVVVPSSSLSGVSLLLKIMEHHSFKQIPVVSKLHLLHESFLCAAMAIYLLGHKGHTLKICTLPNSGCAYFVVSQRISMSKHMLTHCKYVVSSVTCKLWTELCAPFCKSACTMQCPSLQQI